MRKKTNCVDLKTNNVNLNGANVVAIHLKLFHFIFHENC